MLRYLILTFFFIQIVFSQDLLITEIMYDPEGNDKDREWIEVINNSSSTIFIESGRNGWRLNDGQNHLFKNEAVILPGEVFIISQNLEVIKSTYPLSVKVLESKFSLKNIQGEIKILDKYSKIIGQASYSSSVGANNNGFSLNWVENKWQEMKPSPGFDLNKFEMTTETVTNLVSDGEKNQSNNVFEDKNTEKINIDSLTSSFSVIISEFYPNPEGNDIGEEFVELYNFGSEVINLEEFKLEINSKKMSLSGQLKPKSYLVIKNKQSIRNSGEKLILFWQDKKIFEITYQGKAPAGMSFARQDNGQWQFTQPTPGEENVFNEKLETREKKESIAKELETNISLIHNQLPKNNLIQIENQSLILILAIIFIVLLSVVVWLKF